MLEDFFPLHFSPFNYYFFFPTEERLALGTSVFKEVRNERERGGRQGEKRTALPITACGDAEEAGREPQNPAAPGSRGRHLGTPAGRGAPPGHFFLNEPSRAPPPLICIMPAAGAAIGCRRAGSGVMSAPAG